MLYGSALPARYWQNFAVPDMYFERCRVLLGWVTKCSSDNEYRLVEFEAVIRDSHLLRSYWRCENLLGLSEYSSN